MSGTVNIARSIFDDEAFKDQPLTEREAFIWMIMEASWKPRAKRIGNVTVNLDRGQLAASVRFMADAWKWEKSTVDRFLKRLEKRDMIGTASGTGINVITICKYDDYQGGEKQSGTAKNKDAGQQRDSSGTNEKKGERREEDISSSEEIVIRAVDDVSEAVAGYNEAATRNAWPSVQKMTAARRKALRARLADCGGLDGWRCAIGKAEASDFLCGRTAKPWTGFGFDWLTKPANFTKLMEGNYDNRTHQTFPADNSSAFLRSVARAAGSF